jgi:glycosyltransferase involved in cell wall biosynthesis
MKIVMIGQKGLPNTYGGVETHVAHLATRLVRAGHQVIAYARRWYSPKGTTSYNGIKVVRMFSVHLKQLDAITNVFFATLHAMFVVRPDVYHYHGVGPALLAWMPRVFAPKSTVVVTFHSIDRLHEKWGWFAKFMLKLGERASVAFGHSVIAVGKTIAEYIQKTYGVDAVYIPNGISPRRAATDPILLEPFGLHPFDYVLMVSRLVPHKGAHTLIEAWKIARAKQPTLFRGLKLAIVGGSAFTDDYVRSLQTAAAADPSVVMTGYQSNESLEALFTGARFVVQPSVTEGLSLALLEAMAYGKAVIATDIPENREVFGVYGVTFPVNDVEVLAEKMIAFVQDPMQAASLGHVARTYVEDNYNWDDIATETLNIYRHHTVAPEAMLAME